MLRHGVTGHIKTRCELFVHQLFFFGHFGNIGCLDFNRFSKCRAEVEKTYLPFDFALFVVFER